MFSIPIESPEEVPVEDVTLEAEGQRIGIGMNSEDRSRKVEKGAVSGKEARLKRCGLGGSTGCV